MKLVLAAVSALALGAVVATVAVGSGLFERTVVEHPYERGLAFDEERHARERLGWRAAFDRTDLHPGAPLDFVLLDRSGAPVEGAAIRVALARPAGPGAPVVGEAQPLGGGRYRVPAGVPAPGAWDVRLEAARGADRVWLVQQLRVEARALAGPACDLVRAPCTAEAGGLSLTLDLGRDLATMRELRAELTVRRAGQPVARAEVELSFAMRDMDMGENRVALQAAGEGRYRARAVLVRCPSGSRDWVATATVRAPGTPPASARFDFAVRE
jgi:nitrogen fixation protein FixH